MIPYPTSASFGKEVGTAALAELLYRSGLATAIGYRYGGFGAIFAFHRVVANGSSLAELHSDMYVPVRALEVWLAALARSGVEVVSMDEAVRRIADRRRRAGARRFVAITFDDGYIDFHHLALPVLERFGAPFTMYVTTHLVNGLGELWWLGLEHLIKRGGVVEVRPMERRFELTSARRTAEAVRQINRWVWTDVARRVPLLRPVFEEYGISLRTATKAAGLSLDLLRDVAHHPLATIGGHTTSHPWLPSLPAKEAGREMANNKAFLEDICNVAVEHFAYPYGACETHHAAYAEAAGFQTAATNTPGCLFPEHRDRLLLLPRNACTGDRMSLAFLHAQRCGVKQFVQSRIPRAMPRGATGG